MLFQSFTGTNKSIIRAVLVGQDFELLSSPLGVSHLFVAKSEVIDHRVVFKGQSVGALVDELLKNTYGLKQ